MTSFFSPKGGPIWIKFHRLVQNDMLTAVIWSKSKPDVKFQYGRRLGEFNGMSSYSHVSHCRVLPIGEFTVMIPEPHATLQGAVTWQNQCHDRVTLQGVRMPCAILKIVFAIFYMVFFLNAFWALTSGSLNRIVSNTLVYTRCTEIFSGVQHDFLCKVPASIKEVMTCMAPSSMLQFLIM